MPVLGRFRPLSSPGHVFRPRPGSFLMTVPQPNKTGIEIDPPAAAHPPRVTDASSETLSHSGAAERPSSPVAPPSHTGDIIELPLHVAPHRVGPYEILGEIARGGMGVVYRARQTGLDRLVAIKMTLGARFAGAEERLRLQAEARAAGHLIHPNIVPVYDVGEFEGQPYFSMGLIQGDSLKARLANGPLSAGDAARIARIIAEAVQYAHEHGVIHRDLKPANVLMDQDDQPHVTDFGLAKRSEVDSGLTVTGQILGTPSFMPPEQASGHSELVSLLSDVYSLGATLYCMLTGRPPFQAAKMVDTLVQVVGQDPVSPRALNPHVPRDLETICLKSMAKEPSQRYPSAGELAAELGRFEAGIPIRARPASIVEKGWRWCRRNPWLSAATAVAALFLVATAVLSTALAVYQTRVARETSQRERATVSALAESRRNAAMLAMNEGRGLCEAGDFAQGLKSFAQALEFSTPDWPDLERVARTNLGDWQHELRPLMHTIEHPCNMGAMAVSADGKTLAAGYSDGSLDLWDLATLKRRRPTLAHAESASLLALTADGQLVALVDQLGQVHIWEVATGLQRGAVLKFPEFVEALAFSPNGKCLAVGCNDAHVRLYETQTLRLQGEPVPTSQAVDRLIFSPDSRWLAVCWRGGTARLVDTATGRQAHELGGHDTVATIAFTRDGKQVATFGKNPGGKLWNLETMAPTGIVYSHPGLVRSAAFSRDGALVATGSDDGSARLWTTATGAPVGSAMPHTGEVVQLAFRKDGKRLLTGGFSGDAQVWNTANGHREGGRMSHHAWSRGAAYGLEETCIVTGSADGVIKVWDVQLAESPSRVFGAQGAVWGLRFSPDSNVLAASDFAGFLHLWNADTGEPIGSTIRTFRMSWDLAFNRDGTRVATASDSMFVFLYDPHTGQPVGKPFSHTGPVSYVAFHPNGRELFSAGGQSRDGIPIISRWQFEPGGAPMPVFAAHGELLSFILSPDGETAALASGSTKSSQVHLLRTRDNSKGPELAVPGAVEAMSFSPDNRLLLTSGTDRDVRLWSVETGALIHRFAHPSDVPAIAFSHDGQRVATGCSDRQVRFWNTATGELILPTLPHSDGVHQVAFSPDDQTLASGSADKIVRFWNVATGQPIGRPELHSGYINRLDYSRDGKKIASGTADAEVHLRSVPKLMTGRPDEIRERINRWTTGSPSKSLLPRR